MSLQQCFEEEKFASFVDGSFCFNECKNEHPLISPVTQSHWKTLEFADAALTKKAISAAEKGFESWKHVPGPQRANYLRKIGNLLIENKDVLSQTMAMEMGKPIQEGIKEVEYAAAFYFWFAGEAERIYGISIPSSHPNKSLMIMMEPAGVCGIITPWNFPLAMGARKIAAALAAGCTVVVKPSPECPISMLLFAEACRQVNLPNGVVNVLIGPEDEIGKELLDSKIIRKISFTGSCQVGRYLYRESANTLKKLTLELGGHAPLIIYDDADLNKAIPGTMIAKFRNSGQTCIAANRILIQKGIYDEYVKRLLEAIEKLVIGSPLNPKTDLSINLHPLSAEKVDDHVRDALHKKAKALLLGQEPYFPTVLSEIKPDMKIFHEETFGPVIGITPFGTMEEGLALANQSDYGLAAYVFTESLSKAKHSVDQLQYGIIGLNDGLPSAAQAAFGGIKDSGFGREGGPSGLREYLVEKYVSTAF